MPYKDREKQKEAQHQSYLRNKDQISERNREFRLKRRAWLDEQKQDKPCLDCGISYPPYVMEFHHRDRSEKDRGVSILLRHVGKTKILEEIAKCDLLCANCHRIREYAL